MRAIPTAFVIDFIIPVSFVWVFSTERSIRKASARDENRLIKIAGVSRPMRLDLRTYDPQIRKFSKKTDH
jgi:hypothetical protein